MDHRGFPFLINRKQLIFDVDLSQRQSWVQSTPAATVPLRLCLANGMLKSMTVEAKSLPCDLFLWEAIFKASAPIVLEIMARTPGLFSLTIQILANVSVVVESGTDLSDIKIQNNLPQPYPCEELPLNSSLVQYQPCPAADRLETQRKERTAKKSFRLV